LIVEPWELRIVLPNRSERIRTLKGKYRIARNVFVQCRLDVLEANDRQMLLHLGHKRKADTSVPVGTQIILLGPDNKLEQLTTTVKEVDENHLHTCTPLKREPIEERRQESRVPVDFKLWLATHELKAIDGNIRGFTLQAGGSHGALTSLVIEHVYEFRVAYKDVDYVFDGVLRHIHYDWNTYRHRLGVHFPGLSPEQETIFNLLIDPTYIVPLAESSSIDTSTGKISL
jgi:hypothetical protein